MLGEPNMIFSEVFRESLDLRVETFQKVLVGEIRPLERRVLLVQKTQELTSEMIEESYKNDSVTQPQDQDSEEEEDSDGSPDPDRPDYIVREKVEVNADSPSDEEIRVANYAAEQYPGAIKIAVPGGDIVRVHQPSGASFDMAVPEVLDREFDEDPEIETQSHSAPSMSTAAEHMD